MRDMGQTPIVTLSTIHLLDLDGTLMDSAEVDNRCYWEAIGEVFQQDNQPKRLEDFRHVTDTGILNQWCRQVLNREPSEAEIIGVKEVFLKRLTQALTDEPGSFVPLPGVKQFLEHSIRQPNQALAIATGGWRHSALFKLQASGLAS